MSDQYYLIGGAVRNGKNLWLVTDTGATLSVTMSLNKVDGVSVTAICRDFNGSFYIGSSGGKVEKYDRDWNLETDWGTDGYVICDSGVNGLAIDSLGYLAITYDRVGSPYTDVMLRDAGGSLVWKSLYGLAGHRVMFNAVGDVVMTANPSSGGFVGAIFQRSDGTLLKNFFSRSGSGWWGRGLALCTDGDITIGAGNSTFQEADIRRTTSEDVPDWTTQLLPVTWIVYALCQDSSEDVFCACTRNSGNKTLYKLTNSGGAECQYDTGATARDITINGFGEVVVLSDYATDEDSHASSLRVLSTAFAGHRYLSGDVLSTSSVVMIAWQDSTPPPVEISPIFQGTGAINIVFSWNAPPTNTLFYRPETPVVEHLKFRTQVMRRLDGSEHRTSLRKAPRAQFEYNIRDARQYLESLFFGEMPSTLSIPKWHAPVFLTAVASGGAAQVTVSATTYSEVQNAAYVIVYRTPDIWDVMQVDTVTTNLITFVGGVLSQTYPVGTQVMPVASMAMGDSVQITRRMAANLYSLKLDVVPEDSDLASAAAWSTYMSKVLLADVNACEGELKETISQGLLRLDNQSGTFTVESLEAISKRGLSIGFMTHSYQELYELRQLLHYLHGRWRSFFTVAFVEDVTPVAAMTVGTLTMDIAYCGYTDYVGSTPRWIRVVKTDGTVVTKKVTGSTKINSTTERLTIDVAWAATIAVADVDRIEFQDLVRFDSDDITIMHRNALGCASCTVPVIRVLAITADQVAEEGIT